MNSRVLSLFALLAAVVAVIVLALGGGGGGGAGPHQTVTSADHPAHRSHSGHSTSHQSGPAGPPYPVAHVTRVFIDRTRTEQLPGGASEPRHLRTLILYPQPAGRTRAFPLIVFGHGFAVTPLTYGALLHYWASQGFVVAAPFFPLESHNAPGGPNESDLPNQPGDMKYLITRLLEQSASGAPPLAGRIDANQIAVAGQSDGGDTALAVADSGAAPNPLVKASVILSGAEIPGDPLHYFPPGSPPLLAVQGLADTINPPSFTYQFYSAARAPKYLLTLPGAKHLPPYQRSPDLPIVERVTVAFLRRYLEGDHAAGAQLATLGNVPGQAHLSSSP